MDLSITCAMPNIIIRAMNYLPYTCTKITTPQQHAYSGQKLSAEVSAVVILRSGGTLENGLKRVVPEARIGRLLIQSNSRTGEPELHYLKLPPALSDHRVLLLDPQVASGAGAIMAMQVVKDHGVKEENIVLVTYLSSIAGLRRITKVHPRVKIVTGCVREGFERRWVDSRYVLDIPIYFTVDHAANLRLDILVVDIHLSRMLLLRSVYLHCGDWKNNVCFYVQENHVV